MSRHRRLGQVFSAAMAASALFAAGNALAAPGSAVGHGNYRGSARSEHTVTTARQSNTRRAAKASAAKTSSAAATMPNSTVKTVTHHFSLAAYSVGVCPFGTAFSGVTITYTQPAS
jgi:hypothetical protein